MQRKQGKEHLFLKLFVFSDESERIPFCDPQVQMCFLSAQQATSRDWWRQPHA